jgi:hypothetical protein
MSSHMAAQAGATARNSQAELLVETALQLTLERLERRGQIGKSSVTRQPQFKRNDCSDVFDHLVEIESIKTHAGQPLVLWAQTTCYKGHTTTATESNKTYEIRETLIEALGLRRWLRKERVSFRTIHFTVGPAAYAYGWFADAKRMSFDLSVYPPADTESLFEELDRLLHASVTEKESLLRIRNAGAGAPAVVSYLENTEKVLLRWFSNGALSNPVADAQADLIERTASRMRVHVNPIIAEAALGGAGIKPRVVRVLGGETDSDAALMRAAARVVKGNPFLETALKAEADWKLWCDKQYAITGNPSLVAYVRALWCSPEPARRVTRRLLLRIHQPSGVPYVADLGVAGVTEHTLYMADQDPGKLDAIVSGLVANLRLASVRSAHDLEERMRATSSRGVIRASRRFESGNGASVRPSFFYVEEALPSKFKFVKFAETDLASPVGYHASFTKAQVNPYDNLRVIVNSRSGTPRAIIKAKFFRQQEFARRAKEEAYVGLTLMHDYASGRFVPRYGSLPLIMFVDMDSTVNPPEFALRRLLNSGWLPTFTMDGLLRLID